MLLFVPYLLSILTAALLPLRSPPTPPPPACPSIRAPLSASLLLLKRKRKKRREKDTVESGLCVVCFLWFARGRVPIASSVQSAALPLQERWTLSAAPRNNKPEGIKVCSPRCSRCCGASRPGCGSHSEGLRSCHTIREGHARAVILTLSHLEKLEQRYETFGVVCQPELVLAGSDYTVLVRRKAGRERSFHLPACECGYNNNPGIPWCISEALAQGPQP